MFGIEGQKQRKKEKLKGRETRDLGIEHEGAEDLSVVHGSAEVVEGLLVVVVSAMGEVKASNIHASPQQLLQHLHRPR